MSRKRLDKYREEADKMRKMEQKNQSAQINQKPTSKTIQQTPKDDELWHVYRALYRRSVGILWLLPLSFSVVFYLYFITQPYLILYGTLGLSAIPLSRWAYLNIRLYAGFAKFRRWRKQLPFTLEGWENLVDMPNFTRITYWRLEASIQIDFQPTETFTQKDLEDLLYIFCNSANKAFYPAASVLAGFASDPRKKWQSSTNEASGSLNNQVVFYIHQFLANDMASLVKEHQNQVKVILKASMPEYRIDFEDSDSGGGTAS